MTCPRMGLLSPGDVSTHLQRQSSLLAIFLNCISHYLQLVHFRLDVREGVRIDSGCRKTPLLGTHEEDMPPTMPKLTRFLSLVSLAALSSSLPVVPSGSVAFGGTPRAYRSGQVQTQPIP